MTGIILLAAGESSRFGTPKQLAELGGKSLLRRAAETALEANLGPVNVVLGAAEELCRTTLSGIPVNHVLNPVWKAGMGGSIIAGLCPWIDSPLEGVIIMLADQPGVMASHLRDLAAADASNHIVASRYAGQLGVPAWFSVRKFDALLKMKSDQGAKQIIAGEASAAWLDLPCAAWDVDTPADLMRIASDLTAPRLSRDLMASKASENPGSFSNLTPA